MNRLIKIAFLFVTINLFAQEEKKNISSYSFQFDIGSNQIKEKNLHPKVHSGILYGLSYEYKCGEQNISQFKFGINYSTLKTDFENSSESINIQVIANYSYLFELIKKNRFSYCLGPEINLNYNLSFYPNWDESHFYWADFISLGISNKIKYQINQTQFLTFDLSIPLFSVFSRPELNRQYKIDDISFSGILKNMNSNLEIGSLNKSFYMNLQIEYQFVISDKFMQAISYSYILTINWFSENIFK